MTMMHYSIYAYVHVHSVIVIANMLLNVGVMQKSIPLSFCLSFFSEGNNP